MSKQEQIENAKRQIEIARSTLVVAEANLKKLEETPHEVMFDNLTFRVNGVGIGIYRNGEKDMIDYLASWFDGNQVKILRDFLNEKLKVEGLY